MSDLHRTHLSNGCDARKTSWSQQSAGILWTCLERINFRAPDIYPITTPVHHSLLADVTAPKRQLEPADTRLTPPFDPVFIRVRPSDTVGGAGGQE